MNWVTHDEDQFMPDWLKSEIPGKCPECGAPILNGYNENNECTRRICSNTACPKMIGARVGQMCTVLGIAGIKEGNGYRVVKERNLTNHFDAIPYILDEKPTITTKDLFQLLFIFGAGTEFDSYCAEYDTVDEIIANYHGKFYGDLYDRLDLIERAKEVFNIKSCKNTMIKYNPIMTGVVVIHGEIPGVSNRDTVIPSINNLTQGLTQFSYSPHKRLTGLYCCISEDKSSTSGKVMAAKQANAPIYTYKEFLTNVLNKLVSSGHGDIVKQILGGGQ